MGGDSGRKIVVIEDDDNVRALLESMLGSAGHRVVTVAEATDVVGLVRRESPDLILCDIAMPDVDGYGVLSALRADPATAHYPFVFLTAHREFSERVRAFKLGAVDYITKPFTRETLLRKVERLLKGLDRRSEERAPAPAAPLAPAPDAIPVQPVGEAAAREWRDPPRLPGAADGLPTLEALPEMLRTVLVADDNALFRRFLCQVLRSQGFTVHEAAGGQEALKIALERRPWLILSDVSMPEGDGFELCRSVRAQSLISHTPFVFLSGWDDYKERYRGLQLGADEFLSKETPVRELLLRLHLILRRYADLGSHTRTGPGMQGGIEVVGAPGILQMCHQGRLSGICTVRSGSRVFEIRFKEGEIVGARLDDRTGADAIFEFLSWTRGHFELVPGDPGEGVPLGETFDQLLLEGCRRLDEARRNL